MLTPQSLYFFSDLSPRSKRRWRQSSSPGSACLSQVSEQTDTLRVLGTDPVDYLVTPRVIACCLALPILTLLCFTVGMAASVLLADAVYNVSSNIILDSAARALQVGCNSRPQKLVSSLVLGFQFPDGCRV